MDEIIQSQTSPTPVNQKYLSLSPGSSWNSAVTMVSSPSYMSGCNGDDIDQWNTFSDSGGSSSSALGHSISSTMQIVAGRVEPESLPIPTPLDTGSLHAVFSEYDKLVNGQEVPRERHGISDKDNGPLGSNYPEPSYKAATRWAANPICEPQRGISKRKTQRRKKVASCGASRTKRALASSVHEYEYMHLGQARRASNGSIEVEVFWAPVFLPCDQLRGEQAIEEAKDLVIRNFGHAGWEGRAGLAE